MLVDGVVGELGVAGGAHGVPGLLEGASAGGDASCRRVGGAYEVGRALDGPGDHLGAHQRIATARGDRPRREGRDAREGVLPVAEMTVAAVAGGAVLDDVAGEHDLLVRHPDHRVPGGVRAAQMHDVDAAVAEIDAHAVGEGSRRPSQARYLLVALEEAGEAGELAVPVLLAALGDHGAGRVRHDDLARAVGGGAEHAHGVVVGEDEVSDGLVCDPPHLLDHHARKARRGLRLDDHHAVVADDDAGVRIALGREGPEPLADFREGDRLLGRVVLAREAAHGPSTISMRLPEGS